MIFQYYYAEYKWLVDFALSAFIFNVIVELISLLFPTTFKNDISLTPVWNFLVIFFSLYPLTVQMSLAENLWPSYLGVNSAIVQLALSQSQPCSYKHGKQHAACHIVP